MDFTSEFWSGVMAGVFGTFGFCLTMSVLIVWLLARNAPIRNDW